jgi:hypothetical protein
MSAEACVGGGGGGFSARGCVNTKNNQCQSSKNAGLNQNDQSDTTIEILSRGSRPKSLDKWLNEDFKPIPIQVTPIVISDLLTEENLKKDSAYGFDSDLDAAGIRALIFRGNKQFCQYVLKLTAEQCNQKLTGGGG